MSKATTIGAVALGLLFVAAIVTLNSGGSVGSDASTATELDSHHNNKIKMWVGYVKQERQVAPLAHNLALILSLLAPTI